MRFRRFQSGDTSNQFKTRSHLCYSIPSISALTGFPWCSTMSLIGAVCLKLKLRQPLCVSWWYGCLQMICLSPSILFFPPRSLLSRFSSFLVLMCLWLPHFHSYVFIPSVFFSPFPFFSLQGGHMVDRQTDGSWDFSQRDPETWRTVHN